MYDKGQDFYVHPVTQTNFELYDQNGKLNLHS